jgi:hypothetical protein
VLEQLHEDLRIFGAAKGELYSRIDKMLRELAKASRCRFNALAALLIQENVIAVASLMNATMY